MNFVGVSTSQQGDSGHDEAFFSRMDRGSHALIVGRGAFRCAGVRWSALVRSEKSCVWSAHTFECRPGGGERGVGHR